MRLCYSYRALNSVTTTPLPSSSTTTTTTTTSTLIEPPTTTRFRTKSDSCLRLRSLIGTTTLTKNDVTESATTCRLSPPKLGKRWREYQGSGDWEGLLDPLDDALRCEILRYGHFVDAAYRAFEFDPILPAYATCRFLKNALLTRTGLGRSGYRVTKNLHATCGVQTPGWIERLPSWMSVRSSWIGYVAVCQDKEEIARLGRRDVVIALRGTATCLEWLENLRTTLIDLPSHVGPRGSGPMVESGFFSLYTSSTATCASLQHAIREEVARVVQSYGAEPLSLTITGHSLGAALAILSAYDITTTLADVAPMVSVFSFGGPRVGNKSLRCKLEGGGTKILRIVNSDDLVTKVPGFVFRDDQDDDVAKKYNIHMANMPTWIQKHVKGSQWGYADVGQELKLSSKESPHLNKINFATCHDLKTYLHLVNGVVSSTCPFRATKEVL
ncbi:Fungal lipase-like domain containing protein [Parasponia andersonii]|uniref:Fungal lipase-like domain containing protein n=1 Tax=Parasponia andersonii TaxID=3476 RepID=A0A2P5A9H8_PARAD|nr:Fungal lipase-like domain containing protein [Parasponia andersonii]